jgi:type IV secretory pathway VirB10-like protein
MSDRTDLDATPSERRPAGADPGPDSETTTIPREPTDVHRSKIPPDDPRLHIERPQSRTLRKAPALLALGGVGAFGLVALAIGLRPSAGPPESKSTTRPPEGSAPPVPLPEILRIPHETSTTGGDGRNRPASDGGQPSTDAPAATPPAVRPPDPRAEARREEFWKARGAGLFAAMDETGAADPAIRLSTTPVPASPNSAGPAAAAQSPADSTHSPDPNLQERKNDFLSRAGTSVTETVARSVTAPASPYELKAGTLIPAVLITGINSDLPGQVVAQVRENVYDTVTGNYLLVPQGSRLIAAYDSMVAWGQERVLLCWNRLIRPDGTSITLDCMPGIDLAGYAGLSDEVDNHWSKLITGAALSSILAATAQRTQGDVTSFQPSLSQSWASNAAGQINQAGQQLTQKNLQLQPTITIRPGFSVNVLVTRDVIISPLWSR